jgi:predicted AlkP superfamily phosphohydrolase/phosphomutase
LSDHGFKFFRRGVNLNTWLVQNGFMTLKEGAEPGEYLQSVDWSRTEAYSIGLGGVYINIKGRERHGIVEPERVDEVKRRVSEGLTGLCDTNGAVAVRRMIDVQRTFDGPYRGDGPELIPGFSDGYRVSWDCAKGTVAADLFEDNVKSWSGDHCVDPEIVPGILFSNRAVRDENPRLMDMGPTVLDLFGVETPPYMTGRSIL